MLPPDNFIYFLILFTINISSATYLFFTYNRNRLLIFNAFGFLLLSARCATEYYLPSIDSYETARMIALCHSFFTTSSAIIVWISAWLYIRPFRNYSNENYFNNSYIGLLLLVHIPIVVLFLRRSIFKLNPEKIDGYWKFYVDYSTYWAYFFFITMIFFSFCTFLLFMLDFYRSKKQRFYKIVLIFIFSVFPILVYIGLMNSNPSLKAYSIPNSVVFYTICQVIANWFFTDYRLFSDTSEDIINDSFNSISDMVVFTEIQLKIKQFNNQAADFFEINEQTDSIVNLLSRKSRLLDSEITEFVNNLLDDLGDEHEHELVLETKGEKRIITFKVDEYRKGGQLFGYTFVIKDITEKREKELLLNIQNKELTEINNFKDMMFAIIGHDIKNPILSFRGIAKKVNFLIRKKEYETLNAMGNQIEKDAIALNNLTDNLLTWTLLQKDIVSLHPELVTIESTINEVKSLFENQVTEKKINFITKLSKEDKVFVDEKTFQIIVRNIIDNAIKFIPVNGTITISAYFDETYTNLRIEDTGLGMSPEKLKNLFVLKKNKSDKDTSGKESTGLGMYIVKELIEINHGKIEVKSKVSFGTTIDILFPSNNVMA